MVVSSCYSDAAFCGVGADELAASSLALHAQLIRPPDSAGASGADALAKLVALSIELHFLHLDFKNYAELFHPELSMQAASKEMEKKEARWATLKTQLVESSADDVDVPGLVITKNLEDIFWGSLEWTLTGAFAPIVLASCSRERILLAETVEEATQALDRCRAELNRLSITGADLRAQKRARTRARQRILRLLNLWAWWGPGGFDAGTSLVGVEWKGAAAAAAAMILGKDESKLEGPRSFPWSGTAAGGGVGPAGGGMPAMGRHAVLKYLHADTELKRSMEELTIFLPTECERSRKFFSLSSSKVATRLAAVDAGIRAARGGLERALASASAEADPNERLLYRAEASASSSRLAELEHRRIYLRRRERELVARRRQGDEACMNWYGKGIPFSREGPGGRSDALGAEDPGLEEPAIDTGVFSEGQAALEAFNLGDGEGEGEGEDEDEDAYEGEGGEGARDDDAYDELEAATPDDDEL